MAQQCELCRKAINLYEKICSDCALTVAQAPGGMPGREFNEEERPQGILSLADMLKMMIRHGGFNVFIIRGIKPKILLLDAGVTGPVPISTESLTTGDCIRLLYPILTTKELEKLSRGSYIEVPLTFERHLFSIEITVRNQSPEALITAEAPIRQKRQLKSRK